MGSGIICLLFLGIFWILTPVALQIPQLPSLPGCLSGVRCQKSARPANVLISRQKKSQLRLFPAIALLPLHPHRSCCSALASVGAAPALPTQLGTGFGLMALSGHRLPAPPAFWGWVSWGRKKGPEQ